MLDGNAYIRVQTTDEPLGKIVGKITPNLPPLNHVFNERITSANYRYNTFGASKRAGYVNTIVRRVIF